VRRGEILGIAGADGNGQLDLLRALARIDDAGGTVMIDGRAVTSYRQTVASGAVFLSGDRANGSLLTALSVRENLTVGVLSKLANRGILQRANEVRHSEAEIERYGVRVGDAEHPITSLSGGNQQKVAISRVLATNPRALFIEEPTQGVDVRSRMEIYRFLRAAADAGLAVVLHSSDASELAGLADRIVVLSRGRIVEEFAGTEATEESIVGAFVGATHLVEAPVDEGGGAQTSSDEKRPPARMRSVNDFPRMTALAVGLLLIGAYARLKNDTFLTTASLRNIALFALPLALVAIAEYCVLVMGGLDIAVAGTIALTAVTLSFVAGSGGLAHVLLVALLVALGVGLAVGATNALLIEGAKVTPVIATIATLGASTGIALMLRPTAGGLISDQLGRVFKNGPGFLPWLLIAVGGMVMVGDLVLWRSGTGLLVRAVGLNPVRAQRLGQTGNAGGGARMRRRRSRQFRHHRRDQPDRRTGARWRKPARWARQLPRMSRRGARAGAHSEPPPDPRDLRRTGLPVHRTPHPRRAARVLDRTVDPPCSPPDRPDQHVTRSSECA